MPLPAHTCAPCPCPPILKQFLLPLAHVQRPPALPLPAHACLYMLPCYISVTSWSHRGRIMVTSWSHRASGHISNRGHIFIVVTSSHRGRIMVASWSHRGFVIVVSRSILASKRCPTKATSFSTSPLAHTLQSSTVLFIFHDIRDIHAAVISYTRVCTAVKAIRGALVTLAYVPPL